MAVTMDCTSLYEEIIDNMKERVKRLNAKGKSVGLATVLVGDDFINAGFVHDKENACKAAGIFAETIQLPESATQRELEAKIDSIMRDKKINGAIIQRPIPNTLDEEKASIRIFPEKDVDGLHINNIGRIADNHYAIMPCEPRGIMYMFAEYEIELEGKHAVIVGTDSSICVPIAMMLMNEKCNVTICDAETENLSDITSNADILIVHVGIPNFITDDMVKEGAVVIDAGMNWVEDGFVGDVDFDAVEVVAGYITEVGGVNKMGVAMLIQNTVECAEGKYYDSYHGNIYEQ